MRVPEESAYGAITGNCALFMSLLVTSSLADAIIANGKKDF
jgi:hypothetical protein